MLTYSETGKEKLKKAQDVNEANHRRSKMTETIRGTVEAFQIFKLMIA